MNRLFVAVIALLTLSAELMAGSTWWEYENTNPHGNHSGGRVTNITTRYTIDHNTNQEYLSWSHTIEKINKYGGKGKKGHGHHHHCDSGNFWLVLTPGPNPKQHASEYVIFYGDTKNDRLTSYVYNGVNGPDSFKTSKYLGTSKLRSDSSKYRSWSEHSFNLNVTSINNLFPNNPDWQGAKIGNKVGLWFHTGIGKFRYNKDGSIKKIYESKNEGWYDYANDDATITGGVSSVPEPKEYAMWMLCLGTLIAFKRRQSKLASVAI